MPSQEKPSLSRVSSSGPEGERPELEQLVAVARIGRGEAAVVEADGEARGRVARRLGVPDVAALRCRWTLSRRPGTTDEFEADGVLDALVTRTCVVTLELLEEAVHETFSVVFVPASAMPVEDDSDPDSPDLVPYDGAAIDLGEATVEQLALALDPFPRVPDELRAAGDDAFGDAGASEGAADARPNPFSVLAARRGNG